MSHFVYLVNDFIWLTCVFPFVLQRWTHITFLHKRPRYQCLSIHKSISREQCSNMRWTNAWNEKSMIWYRSLYRSDSIDWDVKQSPNFSFNWGLNYEGWDSTDSPESLGDKLVEMPRLRAMRLFKKSRNIQAIIHNSFLRPMILLIPWYRLLMMPFLR